MTCVLFTCSAICALSSVNYYFLFILYVTLGQYTRIKKIIKFSRLKKKLTKLPLTVIDSF